MQFTPQQLGGGGRYAPKTRIGNWNEDLMLEESRMREYHHRKQQGSLLATYKLKHDYLHQPVYRSFNENSIIHFNHKISLKQIQSLGLLVCNVFEETPNIGSNEYFVTVAPSDKAVSRSVFRIVDAKKYKDCLGNGMTIDFQEEGDILCYGESFLLMCHEALLIDGQSALLQPPLFLKSGLKSDRSMSPISCSQRVWLSEGLDSSALWVCARADLGGVEKYLASGSEVRAGDKISLVHTMTGLHLASDKNNTLTTDHGVEFEVCAFSAKTAGKRFHLQSEALGKSTADTAALTNMAINTWTFVLGDSKYDAQHNQVSPQFPTVQSITNIMRIHLSAVSIYAFCLFIRELEKLDKKSTGYLNRDETLYHLKEYKFPLREQHLDFFLGCIDPRKTGQVQLNELKRILRIKLTSHREHKINNAYDQLLSSIGCNGIVTLDELCAHYDPTIDSRVREKVLSDAAACKDYRSLWRITIQKDVPRDLFHEVYSDISLSISDETQFACIMQESWR